MSSGVTPQPEGADASSGATTPPDRVDDSRQLAPTGQQAGGNSQATTPPDRVDEGSQPASPDQQAAGNEPVAGPTSEDHGLLDLVQHRRVVICAGPGGVGKTTIAAACALEAARRGRRACVVTIDPARRLADALGLSELSNDPRQVGGVAPGELWALMLDTKTTFDALVSRYAPSPEQAETILGNRLYRNISGALGGTQEYMAVEKLWELVEDSRFDLVVVDTPPTRNALDFLEAPGRLSRFLGNRVLRMLMMPTRAGLRAVNMATQMLLRSISKVVGGDLVADVVAFLGAFEGMDEGFRQRAEQMLALLHDPGTAFVVVAAPRRDAVAEAGYFLERLRESSLPVEAVVVNRVTPRWGPVPPLSRPPAGAPAPDPTTARSQAARSQAARDQAARDQAARGRAALDDLVTNLEQLERTARQEERHIQALGADVPGTAVTRVRHLDSDVHDLAGLAAIASLLTDTPGKPSVQA